MEYEQTAGASGDPATPTKPFRFKRGRSGDRDAEKLESHARTRRRRQSPDQSTHHARRKSHRKRHSNARHTHRTHTSPEREPNIEIYNGLNQDTESAFRESLFDALADDEGAAYWEGVYGQPIHTYPSARANDETGELERMSEDEYVAYVRARMWEKTHGYILEERQRQQEARRKMQEEQQRRRTEGRSAKMEDDEFQRRMDQSLRLGKERRENKSWKDAWRRYIERWEKLTRKQKDGPQGKEAKTEIPWPVKTGQKADVKKEAVIAFFEHAAGYDENSGDTRAMFKAERVRWHPDKMQQRCASAGLTESDLKTITAVFQFVDDLWSHKK